VTRAYDKDAIYLQLIENARISSRQKLTSTIMKLQTCIKKINEKWTQHGNDKENTLMEDYSLSLLACHQ
jgi:hypothetical protein